MKLYRYRPLNEFLFKELFYRELYFASPKELNDPLDLNTQLDFYSEDDHEIKSLSLFIYRELFFWVLISDKFALAKEIKKLEGSEVLLKHFKKSFSEFKNKKISQEQFYNLLSTILENHLSEEDFKSFNIEGFVLRQNKTINQFFNNSSVVCFSETCTDFLMWSHYASSHTGVCLEFEVGETDSDKQYKFDFSINLPTEENEVVYTRDVKKVSYPKKLVSLKIYDYLYMFQNKDDFDLINLSKARWHGYAHSIEDIFLQKLLPWSKEEEWRIVDVAFQSSYPEDRILNYSCSSLTGIYFLLKLFK